MESKDFKVNAADLDHYKGFKSAEKEGLSACESEELKSLEDEDLKPPDTYSHVNNNV